MRNAVVFTVDTENYFALRMCSDVGWLNGAQIKHKVLCDRAV